MNRNHQLSPPSDLKDVFPFDSASANRVGEHADRAAAADAGPKSAPPPQIESEVDDEIRVGAGGKLIVPREDIDVDIDIGEDLDLAAMLSKKIRKPHRREFISVNAASELTTRLLLHKPKADGIETEYFYVHPSLRAPIMGELKQCRVFVYYSPSTKTHNLWIIHVTPENSWYESLQALFRNGPEFFAKNTIRVMSDKAKSAYRVRARASTEVVTWPTVSTEVLLGEALGHDKFINSADHPLYRDLIDGVELN